MTIIISYFYHYYYHFYTTSVMSESNSNNYWRFSINIPIGLTGREKKGKHITYTYMTKEFYVFYIMNK